MLTVLLILKDNHLIDPNLRAGMELESLLNDLSVLLLVAVCLFNKVTFWDF
jgi:hypothetical protein